MQDTVFENERKKAIATLVRIGAAKYVKDMDLYHGRAGDGSPWQVNPLFNNGGNNTGNRNVYSVSGLYAGDQSVAQSFADARVRKGAGKVAEVHKIVSSDNDAIIFDLNFNENNLPIPDLQAYYLALQTLTKIGLTQGNPVKYEYKKAWPIVTKKCQEIQKKYNANTLPTNLVDEIITELSKDSQIREIFQKPSNLKTFVNEVIGAYNTKKLLASNPRNALTYYINGNTNFNYSNSLQEYPYSSSYTSAWCANNHIVGISQLVDSATLDKTITTNVLFDTKKIMSEKQHGEMLSHIIENFEDLTMSLGNIVDSNTSQFLTNASSREIMEYINKSPMCKVLYDKSAYIWEGWTVSQHTESVIKFFDEYFQEEMPNELKPFMKVVLLAHDIGKGYAKENNIPQDKGNLANTKHLYNALNIDHSYRSLIDYIISDSQKITTDILLNKGNIKDLKEQLKMTCRNAFVSAFNKEPNDREITGLMKVCTILQSCDSGAYTRYAKVRDGDKMVSGANDNFTSSFTINQRGVPRIKVFEDEGM